jgi:hypothetical protein
MKTILFLCLVAVLCSFVPADEGGVRLTLPLTLTALAGIYEVLSRIIPTSRVWSIIGKALEVLTWLSNLLNRKKK